MRRLIVAMGAAVVVAGGLSACGTSSSSSVSVSPPGASTNSCTKPGINKLLFKPNVLTIATDTPVYTPWFVGNIPKQRAGVTKARSLTRSPSRLGFSQVTGRLGARAVQQRSISPGPKAFDFDINEVSYTPQRAAGRHVLEQLLPGAAGDRGDEGHGRS